MAKQTKYILVDPFARADSGVSTYVAAARPLLEHAGHSTLLITRRKAESIEGFRRRLAVELGELSSSYRLIVEAPETLAATAQVADSDADIHIRLHFSRQVGQKLQGLRVDASAVAIEQAEMSRARFISAPSRAAVDASQLLFKLPSLVSIFPNPLRRDATKSIPASLGSRVYFVGRFQVLKGTGYFIELARSMPDVEFAMVGIGDSPPGAAKLPNLEIIGGQDWSVARLAEDAAVVVVPSLFETASMVGLEALSVGVPVVCWSHLGLAEYANRRQILAVEAFDIEKMASAIRTFLLRKKRIGAVDKWVDDLNNRYVMGVRNSLAGRACNFMPVRAGLDQIAAGLHRSLQGERSAFMHTRTLPPWRRKLRKLLRDPKRFVADSKLMRRFWTAGNRQESLPTVSLRMEDGDFTQPLLCDIRQEGAIRFAEAPAKPRGVICALLYPDNVELSQGEDSFYFNQTGESAAIDIVIGLTRLENFPYLQPPMLQIGRFDTAIADDPVAFIDRIDVSNKSRLSKVDNIILLDPPDSIVEGLRACGTDQRAIVISTDGNPTEYSPEYVDAMIVVGSDNPQSKSDDYRRHIVVDDLNGVPLALRRIVQEFAPKNPNMLLPLLGFEEYSRDEFEDLNIAFCQGIIRSPVSERPVTGTMREICADIAANMTDLAVTEAVYMRYRHLCERIEEFEARKNFLLLALQDGVIFDVQR